MEPQQPENDNPLASEPAEPVTSAPETTTQPSNPEPMPETPTPTPEPPAETPAAAPAEATSTTPEVTPPSASGPVTGGVVDAPVAPTGGKRRLPKFALPVIVAVILLGGTASAYFGYVVPNKPENMWHSALVNTGKGYDKLSDYATTAKGVKGWNEDGSFKFTGPVVVDGTVSGKSDGQNGDFNASVSATGLKLNFDVRGLKSTGDTPDIYFKVDGLQGLGGLLGSFGADPAVAQALTGFNNQWYVVDHTLFEQYAKSAQANTQITSADVSSVLNAVGKASKQYVFTADEQKAVVVMKEKVGKEKLGNRNVYHYKVALNKEHTKAYLTALCQDLKASKLSTLLPSQKDMNCSDWEKAADGIKDGDTADAWVDTHTKLIRDIRITDKADKNNYFDIGQDYQGGNSFPFLFGFHTKSGSDTSDVDLKMTLDTKTNVVKMDGQLKMSGQDAENGTASLTLTPNNQPVKVDKPAGAKNIMQLMNDLGIGNLVGAAAGAASTQSIVGNSSIQSEARDSERQADISSLQTQLEAFFAMNGYYPSLTDMNSASWRAANMQSLDSGALQDPQGTSKTLVATPAAKVYAYHATNASGSSCEADDTTCAQYTLTATLERGGTYQKTNLD